MAVSTRGTTAENPNDDTPTRLERMIMKFSGSHVDGKLRESLDGERTNFLEENYEGRLGQTPKISKWT